MAASPSSKRRVGIVGYGKLGQYLARAVIEDPKVNSKLELAFVWNRTIAAVRDDKIIPDDVVLEDLGSFKSRGADLIVEVAHPNITKEYGRSFLEAADYLVGSPTAFADDECEAIVREMMKQQEEGGRDASEEGKGSESSAARPFTRALYVPAGALWGAKDIQKMANRGTLKGLCVTMKKAPDTLKLRGWLADKLAEVVKAGTKGETVLYEGPVRGLCPLAPNNVNTMACAALAGHTLGLSGTQARLVSDPSLQAHVIDIEVAGPENAAGSFRVTTQRVNPCAPGAVTGSATYVSFVSSMLEAGEAARNPGLYFC